MKRNLILFMLVLSLASGCASTRSHRAEVRKKKKIELQALKHYRQGIDAYVNTRYAEAITEWKQTLDLAPEYPNAKEYIIRAEKAQKNTRAIQ